MRTQSVVTRLYLLLMFPADIIGLWWAVGSPLVVDSNTICKNTKLLAGMQKTICKDEPEVVAEVVRGASVALLECQYQFRNRHWNCTTVSRSLSRILKHIPTSQQRITPYCSVPVPVNITQNAPHRPRSGITYHDYGYNCHDIRESAFVYAITAAGVVYVVTHACSMGTLPQCTCDHSSRDMNTDGEWEWGGCGDNVEYGYRKSRDFMDARKRKRKGDLTTKIQLHNNEAGRLAVKHFVRQECKCHGLSGSCTLKTCWKKMAPFREVGNRLKDKFDGAIRVIISNDGKNIIPNEQKIKPPSKHDLVYSDKSPDFCKKSRAEGSLGTKGRECELNSNGVDGCEILCCGRSHSKTLVELRENCKCRFLWCCEVKCDTCERTKIVHTCL